MIFLPPDALYAVSEQAFFTAPGAPYSYSGETNHFYL